MMEFQGEKVIQLDKEGKVIPTHTITDQLDRIESMLNSLTSKTSVLGVRCNIIDFQAKQCILSQSHPSVCEFE